MNIRDLKNIIEDLDDDLEVRFASQPSWPFEYSIYDAYVIDLNVEYDSEDDEYLENEDDEPKDILYLVEGNQIGYLPGIVAREIGWK